MRADSGLLYDEKDFGGYRNVWKLVQDEPMVFNCDEMIEMESVK